MIWAIIGIFFGIILGFSLSLSIPLELTKYTAVTIIAVLDSLFGAIRAESTNDKFDSIIFMSGLIFNIIVSVMITILGDKLGLELYLAVTFVFVYRIFTNIGATRRFFLEKYLSKKKKN